MARYYQAPKNDIVDLTPQYPVEFYANLMDKAQKNLDTANALGAQFKTDAYGREYVDEKTRDAMMAKGMQPIEEALAKQFVTPSTIAKGVSQSSAILAPYQNLNKKQLELVKAYQEDKRKYGAYFLGNDPTQQSLMQEGKLISPEELKYTAINTKDVYDMFGDAYGANLLKVTDNRVDSNIPYYYKIEKTKGLSLEEKNTKLKVGGEEAIALAKGILDSSPTLKEALVRITGSEDGALRKLQEINLMAAFQDKYAQVKDSQYIANTLAIQKALKAQENITPDGRPLDITTYDRGIDKIEQGRENISSIRRGILEAGGKERGSTAANWVDRNTPIYDAADFVAQEVSGDRNAHVSGGLFTQGKLIKNSNEELENLKKKYKSTYKNVSNRITEDELRKYIPNYTTKMLGSDKDMAKVSRAIDLVFLDRLELQQSTAYSPITAYSVNNKDFDKKMDDKVMKGINKDKIEINGYDGSKIMLSEAYEKTTTDRRFLIRNDGSLDIVVGGKPFELNIFDNDGSGYGVVDDMTKSVLQQQRDLYNALWEFDDEAIYSTQKTKGIPVPVPGYNAMGIPVYTIEKNPISGQPNNIIVTYYDPGTGRPHVDNNIPISRKTTFNEVSKNTAEIIGYLNN